MSVLPTATTVMKTPSVAIPWDHTIVLANLDSMEMAEHVSVNIISANNEYFITFA